MRVRITDKAGYENPRRGLALKCGEVAEVADDLAVKLLKHGMAVPAPAPAPKTAAVAPPENAAKPKPKARRSSRPAKEEAE